MEIKIDIKNNDLLTIKTDAKELIEIRKAIKSIAKVCDYFEKNKKK